MNIADEARHLRRLFAAIVFAAFAVGLVIGAAVARFTL